MLDIACTSTPLRALRSLHRNAHFHAHTTHTALPLPHTYPHICTHTPLRCQGVRRAAPAARRESRAQRHQGQPGADACAGKQPRWGEERDNQLVHQ